jgi:hypothetical protein
MTELGQRFVHHVVFHSPATLAATVIGVVGGAVTGFWNPIGGGVFGAMTSFVVLDDLDDGVGIGLRGGTFVLLLLVFG